MTVHPSLAFLRETASFADVLRLRAQLHPDRPAVGEPLGSGETLTYAELAGRVARLASRLDLQDRSSGQQPFVIIALPNSIEYVVSVFACFASGAAAVTLYPPSLSTRRGVESFEERMAGIIADCSPAAVIGEPDLFEEFDLFPDDLLRVSADTDGSGVDSAPALKVAPVGRDDVAMLQYTSGSTSVPKGVELTHGNLLHNTEAVADRLGSRDGEVCVTWLPLYHDMGLIGSILHPLWAGMTVQLLTPADFIGDPSRWLRLASEHRASMLMAPNFAYELCVRRGQPRDGETLDLSTVRVALNGAEPVRPATLAAFNESFGPHGLPPTAMTPAYGLAENTVAVSFSSDTPTAAKVFAARRSALVQGRYEQANGDAHDRIELVGCGVDIEGAESAIVDPETHEQLADGRVGEIWVTGKSAARGYHARPKETAERFGARVLGRPEKWIRTGDLGVRVGGELCVCGRLKDVIIRNGANHDPADVEATAVAVDVRAPSTAAAFSVPSDRGAEAVVLLQEIEHHVAGDDASALLSQIRGAIIEAHGLRLDAVALVPRGKLPKTTSGKIQRTRARQMWLDGALEVLATSGMRSVS